MIETGIVSKVKIQDVLSNQLPNFIRDESPLTVDFLKQYYVSQEYQGGPSDISDNLDQYLNIDNLTPEVIVDNSTTVGITTIGDKIINVTSTKGFPNQYGLLKIGDEIITYTGITTNSFTGCERGFSGITSYHSDTNKEDLVFSSSSAAEHEGSSTVKNLSSLFLKEFYKKFKSTFLPGLEEINFQSNLDVGTFIGEARSLYQTKGTDESFRILFNVLYGITPKIINLEERLLKPSFANYVRRRICVAELIEGNPIKLKGQSLLKGLTGQTLFRSDLDLDINASISDIEPFERNGSGLTGITTYYKIGLFVGYDETSDVEGDFVIVPNTKSIESVSIGSSIISVDSTIGFGVTGTLISGSNTIEYTDKTVNQFLNCTGVNNTIEPTANIRSNITYFGFEDGDLNKKVVLRLTGVLSDFEQEGNLDVEEGEIISVKSIGDKVENPNRNNSYKEIFCNSWIYNTSSSYFSDFSDPSNPSNGEFILSSKTDKSSLKKGDFVEIVERDTNKIINTGNPFIKTINDNDVALSGGEFSSLGIGTDYKIRKKLNKANSSGAPIEFGNDTIISDIQNVYIEGENAYVSSNSLPSFINNNFAEFSKQINININQISLDLRNTDDSLSGDTGDQTDFSTINFSINHNFNTGDKIFYTYSNGESLVGLNTGIYFTEKVGDKSIKLFGSPSGVADGKNITFSKSDNDGIHNFILFSQKSGQIGVQKLIKKFPLNQNLNDGNNDSTPVGQIGMLKNGVEITNYKSEDKMFFGPLTEVNVLNEGENFDVINPPIISVSSGIGITALVQPVVSGKVEDVFIDTQSFDIDKIISIGVTGGNGSGCIIEPVVGTRFRQEFFNAQPTTSGGGISTVVSGVNAVSRITFNRDHNFINSEPIIYDSNSNPEVIIGTGTSTLINQSIYYPEIVNSRSIKLYESLSDLSSGIGTVRLNGNSSGNHIFKVGLRNTLLGVNVIDGGKNYTNRNLLVKPSGISTSDNKINFINHGFENGDLVNYSTLAGLGSDTPQIISGLSTSLSYYILKDDDNSFRLANAGIGGTILTNLQRNKNISLESTGTGFQSFSYPEIKVIANFNPVGVGTSVVVREITATPKVRGTIKQTYLYESGTGYGSTIINNHKKPIITLKNGKDASIKPTIINGKIDSVVINYVGQEYFSSPDLNVVDPTGLGAGAKLRPIITNGKITDVEIVNAGIGYSTSTSINVKSAGQNAFFDSSVRVLTLNKHVGNVELLEESDNKLKYSFTGYSTSLLGISDLIGWAYDGNPIYGPFGNSNPQELSPLDTRLKSGYNKDIGNIVDRPPNFDVGHFIEDFKYDNSIGDLDEHNGRFEVTTEFPNGVYAYHATVDNLNNPQFPYFIGNIFRSKPISFNFDNNLQTNFNFVSNNLIRNTFPYKVADDFAENDFIVETNEIQDQKIEIDSVSSGSITGFDILSGGSDYKVGEFLQFDNQNTEGDGLLSFISKISGKAIQSVDTTIEKNDNSVIVWSENQIDVFTNSNHNFKNNDIVKITGLSTDISVLNNSFKIGVTTFTTTTISTITASPSAGFTTEIFVSDIPSSVAAGSSIGIGTETLKILNIYRDLNILTIQRDFDSSFGTIHPEGSKVEYLTNKFTINKSISEFDSKVNQKVFFNPAQSIGVGVNDGESTEVSFSFAGQDIKRSIPVKQIFIENHPFKTNQKIKFTRPDSTQISISTESSSSQFNLPSAPEFLYVVNKTPNTIGIKTGIGNNFNEVYFRNINSADSDLYQFETVFDQVIGDVESVKTTVTTTEPHELQNEDQISLRLKSNLSVGIGTSTHVNVSRDSSTGNILFNSIGFNSTGINTSSNTITIQGHGLKTGDKIKYESNIIPEGLENKNYFIYKVDDNNIKLCETSVDVGKNIPRITGIGSTGGSTQSISLINPKIQSVKNNNLVFDLSDSSLTGYEFKIYYDQEYKNDFISLGESSVFSISTSGSNGSVGAALTVGYGISMPDSLYYNLEKTGTISTTDTEVKEYSKISFIDSFYEGSYNISNTTSNSFDIFLNNIPEKLSYNPVECDVLTYNTSSKTAKGSINSIKILSGGSNYKKLPNFVGIRETSIGKDAVVVPTSTSIGNVNKVRIINEGFEYSSDQTLKPESLIASSVNIINTETLGIVSVTNGGADYIEAPDMIIVNTDTGEEIKSGFLEPVMLENSILSVNVVEQPIGLPEKTVTLRTINNTNGIVITEVVSNGSGIFTCKIATPSPVFPIDPFSVGDKVFIEGIEKVGTAGSGFNSSDYGFKLLTVSNYDNGVTPAEVTVNVSSLTANTGIAVTVVKTFSNIINESDYPSFSVTQNQSKFDLGEKLIRNNIPSNFTVSRVDFGKLKIFGKDELEVGDKLLGQNSGSQCEISKIVKNKGKFKTNFSTLKNLNWSDNTGKLDEDFQVVADNDYYQNMSYSIQSPIEWQTLRTQVNNLLHTSGMKNFADTEVVSTSPVGVGSTSDVNVIVDLISEKRVDEIKDIDLVRDIDVVGGSSRFIQFKNIRLSDFISCSTNDVLLVDNIENQFSNSQGTFNEFLNIFDFSNSISNELFNDFLIITKNPSTTKNFDKIQLSNLLILSNGSKNILVEKSDLINSGIGFTNSESNNFANFELVDNNLRFTPNVDLDLTNDRDYDLKIFSSKFNTNSVGVGTSSIGPIDLSSRIQTCTTGITTNIITVPTSKFESLYATLHVIDDSTEEMNLVESFISHSNTDTFLSEAYFNTDNNDLSLNKLGIITSSLSGGNLILSFENNGSNTLKIKSRIIGIGTIGVSDGAYRFKTSGQLDGFERTSLYSGVSTSNIGISTIVNLNSLLFNAVKSIVEVSIGSSKAIHEVLSIHDGTNAYAQQSGSLSVTKDSITEYDPSSGLGTFGANLSGSNFILNFHPDSSSGISTVVSLNHCFYSITDTENTPEDLTYGVITENNSTKLYNSISGNRINRTQFTLKNNSIPIFGKVFNPSDTTGKFISSTGQFNIDNHFFRENEELVYKPASTFVGVGSTPVQFKNGSIIDQLPTTVFAKNVTDSSFFISTTRAGTAVTFVSLGEGNAHELSMAKANEKTLITVDDVAQYPLIRSNVTHTLDSNIGSQVGLTTTIIHLSGISTVSSEDVLKINDEFMKVVNVGFATTGSGPVGSSGTFNTVEVQRSFVGTSATTHTDGTTVNLFRGSYNISGRDIFFTQAPRGQNESLKTENDLNLATSSFNGRVYLRNDYSSNVIYDDVSNQFTGINSTFTIKVGGANTIGIGTTGGSGILFVNGIFQSPSTELNPNKNFRIIESGSGATGVSSIVFTGITSSDGSTFISNNINTNELPRGGVPISIGNTINGLGYAPLVGANVKPLFDTDGNITSIVGVAYSGSDLGIQTAAYNNVTGIITFTTVNEHKFRDSNDFVLIDNMNFTPPLTLRPNEYEVVSIAATNVFGVSVGSSTVSHVYQGSGNLYPFFPNLTFGSGYNGLSQIGVAVTDLGYEHRFVSANTNAIQVVSGSQITPTNAVYDPVTGALQLTVANHGLTTSNAVSIVTGSIFFSCSRDDFRTVHPYPRSTDPVAGINTDVTEIISEDIFSVNVGVNVGSGAQVTATAGVGGTAIFTVGAAGTNYKDPQIFVSQPSYSNLSVRGVSRLGIGATTDTGTGLRVNAIVKPATGIGSTLFEVSGYEIVDKGFGYKKGDVVEAVGLVTSKDVPSLVERSTLTIDEVYNDSFALWQFGDFDYIDSIKTQQDGAQKNFSLKVNNQLVSVEIGNSLNENVNIENIFLVIVNGVIQEPKISYNIVGGTIISFVEPPIPEDDITILFYKGTAGVDSEVNLKQKLIIEEGDKVQITQGSGVVEQDERTVFSLDTSKKLETNAYLGNGISESVDRPLSLIKQKEDRIINKSLVSKKRTSLEPRITPTAKIIGDLSTTQTHFYVDNAELFEYEQDNSKINLSINSRDQIDFVNASATANVSIAGTVSSVSIGIAGTGYDSAPTVKLSAPPSIGVGIGTTATATATIGVGGTVTAITIANPGLGYTIAPKVLISSPIDYSSSLENITPNDDPVFNIKSASGIVTGISTTTLDGKLAIKFDLANVPDGDGGNFTPVFNDPTGNRPIYIFDTRVGTGITSLSVSGLDSDVYHIGESFLDNVYAQARFSTTGAGPNLVGVLTCFIKSDTDTTGLTSTGSKNEPAGRFSVSRVNSIIRGSNPISIGITGRTVGSTTGLSTFPTLKRTGGELTLEQSGALFDKID
mgnify:CR=1 FL=1